MPRGVEDDGKRFRHGRFAGAEAVGGDALDGVGHEKFPERALDVRKRHGRSVEAHVHAVVLLPVLAIVACPAGPRWRDGDKLARAQVIDAVTQRLDPA